MKENTLTLGSLFDGSGGFPLGGILAGITPVWASEVEPFPIRVTEKRLPQMKHYGDVSTLSGADLEPVDIITFGSPCQDLSVAGKRAGIQEGERSNLFFQAIRIVKEMREKTNGAYPRYCVWENVPGAFSSNGGDDFKAVLEAFCRVADETASVPAPEGKWTKAGEIVGDGYSVAWRVLDAQYWGVPQRRARIFLVADFADECAGNILFESEGLCGYSAESFRAWQRAARYFEGGPDAAGCICLNDQGGKRMSVSDEVSGTLRAEDHGHPLLVAAGFCTEHSAKARSIGYEEEISPTLRAGVVPAAIALEHHPIDSRIGIDPNNTVQTLCNRMGTGGGNVPLVMTPEGPLAFGISSDQSHAMLSDNPHAGIYKAKTSRTLDQGCGHPGCNQGGIAVVEKVYPVEGNGQRPSHQGDGWSESDTMYTLNATEQHAIAAPEKCTAISGTLGSYMSFAEDKAQTLMARDYKDPQYVAVEPYYIVRRLTPVECARLQGFPDWWCDGLGDPDPSEEEVAYWMDIFETHRQVISHAKKPKTEKQVRKWLADPYLDSAAYRMWGNGLAAGCAWFVLSAIVYSARK